MGCWPSVWKAWPPCQAYLGTTTGVHQIMFPTRLQSDSPLSLWNMFNVNHGDGSVAWQLGWWQWILQPNSTVTVGPDSMWLSLTWLWPDFFGQIMKIRWRLQEVKMAAPTWTQLATWVNRVAVGSLQCTENLQSDCHLTTFQLGGHNCTQLISDK